MGKTKWKLLALMLCMVLAAWMIQPSLAYYTVIGKATNVVTSGDIELTIHEKTADGKDFPVKDGVVVIPGKVVSKIVTIENTCDQPFYLRVALADGSNNTSLDPKDVFLIDINTTEWIEQSDGYHYYHRILNPGEKTVPFFTQVQIVGKEVNQTHVGSVLTLTVKAHAVQSVHNTAEYPWLAAGWPTEQEVTNEENS